MTFRGVLRVGVLGLALSAFSPAGAEVWPFPVVPPPLPLRTDYALRSPMPGAKIDLVDSTVEYMLYLPRSFRVPSNGAVNLTVNFHSGDEFVIEQHLRRNSPDP